MSTDEVFGILSVGFLRGGIGGFLKSSSSAIIGGQREIRVGVALVFFFRFRVLFEFVSVYYGTYR